MSENSTSPGEEKRKNYTADVQKLVRTIGRHKPRTDHLAEWGEGAFANLQADLGDTANNSANSSVLQEANNASL